MTDLTLRKQIVATALRMNELRINRGRSGNVSARSDSGFLVTPSGLAYEETGPDDIAAVTLAGDASGPRDPSSEWRFHRDIYVARDDVRAIVHAHSTFATTLACLGRGIPAFHYMVAAAGGNDIRCAEYATFGTQVLSDRALGALHDRRACLLANHGMIAVGRSLADALGLAVEVEALAEQYWCALQLGIPNLLSDAEMEIVLQKFRTYGQRDTKE
ncbi:MAG TPA: class II aldolase/adducin family protein [Casimicrobiaceae bacterium]